MTTRRPQSHAADPPTPVQVVELPRPLPLPGQLKPVEESRRPPEPADPAARVNQANAAARVQPVRDGFINAMQVYPFTEGALYQVYTAFGADHRHRASARRAARRLRTRRRRRHRALDHRRHRKRLRRDAARSISSSSRSART